MLRKLVDYKKLDHTLAALLIETYPDGYGDDDILTFKNAHGEIVEAVELRTQDVLYLVKISKSLSSFISNFEDTMEKELDSRPEPVLEEVDAQEMDAEMSMENESDDDRDFD